jgi:hypothetical protein
MVSSFKGKGSSAFLLNGNTGQDGLDWQDSDKFGGGSGNVSMSMDDGNVNYMNGLVVIQIQEPYVDTQMVIKEYQCRCTIQQQMG